MVDARLPIILLPVGLDRDDVERRDFPTARRGYDPEAVDAHLRRLADEIERLGRAAETPPTGLAASASEQVRAILEAAEASADQLRTQAGVEARGHVERVESAAEEMVDRLGRLQGELNGLLEGLRASAGAVTEGLLDLRARVQEMGGEVGVPEHLALSDATASAGPSAPGEVAGPQATPGPTPAEERPPRSTDVEGARLAALELALRGRPRAEAERYLVQHFDLEDPAALLDDVYARIRR
jgi:DivIVA domain-containing protein